MGETISTPCNAPKCSFQIYAPQKLAACQNHQILALLMKPQMFTNEGGIGSTTTIFSAISVEVVTESRLKKVSISSIGDILKGYFKENCPVNNDFTGHWSPRARPHLLTSAGFYASKLLVVKTHKKGASLALELV